MKECKAKDLSRRELRQKTKPMAAATTTLRLSEKKVRPTKTAVTVKRMAAYIIVEIEVTDPVGYEDYRKLAGATVEKFGGEYLVRGGATETLEGDWNPKRLVVLKFESTERAKQWLNSPEYREPRKMRHRTARANMIVVKGVA